MFKNLKIKNLLEIARLSAAVGQGNWKLEILIVIFALFFPSPARAAPNPISYQITVSATVGEPKLTLFGWTSPLSYVELKGQGVFDGVISQKNGYFLFEKVFLPRPNPHYPELCLTSLDRQSRISSFPTCLPPLPAGPFEITVGPVLLPPTLSLEKGNFLAGEQVVARGTTIPRAKVTIFLANNRPRLPKVSIGSHLRGGTNVAYAYFLPEYQVFADENGNFEFNLPAGQPNWQEEWRVYAAAEFLGSPSPKSHTLTFKILSWWAWFLAQLKKLFGAFFSHLKPNWWLLIIVGEICLIAWLWKKRKAKRMAAASSPEGNSYPLG